MTEEELDVRDPYRDLQPVLAGQQPQGASRWEVGEGVTLQPIHSHRNLWSLEFAGVSVVTLDADDFATTADLGVYIEQLLEKFEAEAEAGVEGDTDEDEPRQTERAPSFQ